MTILIWKHILMIIQEIGRELQFSLDGSIDQAPTLYRNQAHIVVDYLYLTHSIRHFVSEIVISLTLNKIILSWLAKRSISTPLRIKLLNFLTKLKNISKLLEQ